LDGSILEPQYQPPKRLTDRTGPNVVLLGKLVSKAPKEHFDVREPRRLGNAGDVGQHWP
jgi:hypothetical protein